MALLPRITLAISPESVTEDSRRNLVYTFTRTGNLTGPLTVFYSLAGTASNGTDYDSIVTRVTFAAGKIKATVTVSPKPDTIAEANETVTLTLLENPSYTIGLAGSATGTILNDDAIKPRISLLVSPESVTEDSRRNLVYTFTRTGNITGPLTVFYSLAGTASNGTDYDSIVTRVTFAAGKIKATVTVSPKPDTIAEADETVTLTLLENATYTIGLAGSATGTILNDDAAKPRISLSVSPERVTEDSRRNLVYTFTRTGNLTGPLTVFYSLVGSATNGTDYDQILTRVSFTAGQRRATVTVSPKPDTTAEPDETVTLTLQENPAYTLGLAGAATGTILNDDVPAIITLAVSPESVREDSRRDLVYTFNRTGDTGQPLTVYYSIAGSATDGTDYNAIPARVTFAAGSRRATVTVSPKPDTTAEPDETVTLTLEENPSYNLGLSSAATGTILNDDLAKPRISLLVSPASVREDGRRDLFYTFNRTGDTGQPLTVYYSIAGSATNGTDYNTIPTGVTFAAGSRRATVMVSPHQDTIAEADETVTLTLQENATYTIGLAGSATGSILDEDAASSSNPLSFEIVPYNDSFDPAQYGASHPDLMQAFASLPYPDKLTAFATHYQTFGQQEGRATDTFDEARYLLSYGDLLNVYGTDLNKATEHYINYGFFEGRDPGLFPCDRYIATYPDLIETFNYNLEAGAKHYLFNGQAEQRQVVFDPENYLNLYGDLQTAFGNDLVAATRHFIESGYMEGRNVTPPRLNVTVLPERTAEDDPGNFVFSFNRTGGVSNPLTVSYSISGSATNGTDYDTLLSEQVTFAAGQQTATLTLSLKSDTIPEPHETVILTLRENPVYTLGLAGAATATILNDDFGSSSLLINNTLDI